MKSCSNCQDENFCYYPGGAPSNNSCDNWSPSDEYKAQKYDEYLSAGTYINNLELLDCKYCGGKPVARLVGDWKNIIAYFCSKCGKTPVHYDEGRAGDYGARKIWNTRTKEN